MEGARARMCVYVSVTADVAACGIVGLTRALSTFAEQPKLLLVALESLGNIGKTFIKRTVLMGATQRRDGQHFHDYRPPSAE